MTSCKIVVKEQVWEACNEMCYRSAALGKVLYRNALALWDTSSPTQTELVSSSSLCKRFRAEVADDHGRLFIFVGSMDCKRFERRKRWVGAVAEWFWRKWKKWKRWECCVKMEFSGKSTQDWRDWPAGQHKKMDARMLKANLLMLLHYWQLFLEN